MRDTSKPDPSMTSSGDFSVAAAAALVLGGIAALLLATVIALGGYGHTHGRSTSVSASGAAPGMRAAGGALPEAEVEYLLDTSEPTATPVGGNP
jgi:hypothetical protein